MTPTVSQDLVVLKDILEMIGDSTAGILEHVDPITSLQNKFVEMQAQITARAGSIENIDSVIGAFF